MGITQSCFWPAVHAAQVQHEKELLERQLEEVSAEAERLQVGGC